jgi:hypothetical protein
MQTQAHPPLIPAYYVPDLVEGSESMRSDDLRQVDLLGILFQQPA